MTQGGKHLVAARWNKHLEEKRIEFGNDDGKLRLYAQELFERLRFGGGGGPSDPKDMSRECRLAYRKFLMSTSGGLSQGWKDLYIDDYSLFAPVTSQEDEDMSVYMNRPDVRKALHVEKSRVASWPFPAVGFDYTKEYDACNWSDDIPEGTPSMIDFYKNIVPRLKVTFVYNGDTDPCVSYEGTREAVKQFEFQELDGGGYRKLRRHRRFRPCSFWHVGCRCSHSPFQYTCLFATAFMTGPWFYNQSKTTLEVLAEKPPLFGPNLLAQSVGAQMGGEVVNYEHGLSFLTFHGSGTRSKCWLCFRHRLI